MGLLDDAIRQHLDLKRQHGADESEIKRKEDEALGPVRREAEPAPEAEAEAPAAPEPAVADEAPVAEEPVADPVDPADDPFAGDEPFADKAPAQEAPDVIDGSVAEDDLPPAPTGDTPPRGVDALEEPPPPAPPAAEDGGEDVLEETPEFLQETPEHDRLWFEQKPPRDFDFDDEEK